MGKKRNSKNKKNHGGRKSSKENHNNNNQSTTTSSVQPNNNTNNNNNNSQPLLTSSPSLENNIDRKINDPVVFNNNTTTTNNNNGEVSGSIGIPIKSAAASTTTTTAASDDENVFTSRRSAVTSRWVDEQDFSPASSPINNVIVVDERHEVKLEILEKSNSPSLHQHHHHQLSSSMVDASIDEQFERAMGTNRKKKKLVVASWSASSIDGEEINDDHKPSTIQKIGEQTPDLILLQDVNYGQLIKSLKCLRKAEEYLEEKHEETMTDNEDSEPPVYKWFCCGHKNSYEPSKLDETIENSEERDGGSPPTPTTTTTTTTSIISRFLQNEVRNRISEDQDPDDFVSEYLPIIYNSERLKCVDCGVHWFASKNHHKESAPPNGTTKSWDSLVPRFCNWAAFVFKPYDEDADDEDYKDFIVFNTHWDQGVESRRYSALSMRQEIIGKMSNYNPITNKTTIVPTITLGNFNSLPKSNALNILVTGTDLGAHNNDDQTTSGGNLTNVDSDDDDDSDSDFSTPYDRESLITPCQRQLLAPSLLNFEKKDSQQSTPPPPLTEGTDQDNQSDDDSSSESESYSGTWYHNVAFEPTFVDQESNQSSTLDYVFISPCVKTLDFQLVETNYLDQSHHKPLISSFEL